ncbi:MAG: ABC transporter ATP-binding protein [Alistipes sp.]|nr:ABC transporter ATP-binding protein [Candidatus Alistipes equi]
MSNKLLSLCKVSVDYDSSRALEDVCLDIYDDDFLAVIGPNGAGKSTLIKAILGLVPHSGTITFSDKLYQNGRLHIGYLPQNASFDRSFPISVEDVVFSGLQGRKGLSLRYTMEDKKLVNELLQTASLENVASRQISEISGGQLQRAMLLRAIIQQPKLLILDEPTNFVDNLFEHELYDMLQVLSKKMAIIIVSHDIGTVTSLVKNIVCVNRHVHRHDSNLITQEQLDNYDCPIQIISHGRVAHTILGPHNHCCQAGHSHTH